MAIEKQNEQRLEDLHKRRARGKRGGGRNKIASQHENGKLTARERIDFFPVSYTPLTLPTKA